MKMNEKTTVLAVAIADGATVPAGRPQAYYVFASMAV